MTDGASAQGQVPLQAAVEDMSSGTSEEITPLEDDPQSAWTDEDYRRAQDEATDSYTVDLGQQGYTEEDLAEGAKAALNDRAEPDAGDIAP